VDMSAASANALRVALSTGLIQSNRATILHAFVPIGKGQMFAYGSAKASIDSYVASERQRAMDEVAAFLVANDLGSVRWPLRVEEGAPIEIISAAVSEMRPDLLVMGTHRRSTVVKALIG